MGRFYKVVLLGKKKFGRLGFFVCIENVSFILVICNIISVSIMIVM